VINLSLGGLGAPIRGAAKALDDARRAGALVVIAAGNDGVDLGLGLLGCHARSELADDGVVFVIAVVVGGGRDRKRHENIEVFDGMISRQGLVIEGEISGHDSNNSVVLAVDS